MSELRGHTTPRGASGLADDWIHRHLSKGVKPKVAINKKPQSVSHARTLLLVDDHHVM
jgi:hypothetical protein